MYNQPSPSPKHILHILNGSFNYKYLTLFFLSIFSFLLCYVLKQPQSNEIRCKAKYKSPNTNITKNYFENYQFCDWGYYATYEFPEENLSTQEISRIKSSMLLETLIYISLIAINGNTTPPTP